MTNKEKNYYNSSVLLKICYFRDRQKAKNLKKTDASFWGLSVFFVVVWVIAYLALIRLC
ncbi:hypothetical protein HMPREF1398_01730 [Helicobacter pylori GAM117Ai]|uniref:hypothetical protein n=1 Tax=Helicobacter pylori TaxID=210 RepID=UPI00038F9BFA|nr:hypothetical protein [Helicobacter pylori]ERA54807.1 hypothetical protein HMPREF1398_01730 [Helicobacter pylori GAM117Ai]